MNEVRSHIEVFNCLVLDLLFTGEYEERYQNRYILCVARGFYTSVKKQTEVVK